MPQKQQENAATELALALGLLVRRMRSAAPVESNEVPWTQMAVMRRLDLEGPATTAELARAEGVKPQSMGATVAALEALGIVARKPHPTDGRQMNITLTEKGMRIRKDARVAKRAWLAQAIAKLDAKEQQRLPALTELLKRLAEL
ncbi:MAG TPA: MarR family transcriptional regulator [Candidatus Kapabacteria bacterium]|nr:MarR family transcriptional regulator [Candidatus Kapabacteria bacterium]